MLIDDDSSGRRMQNFGNNMLRPADRESPEQASHQQIGASRKIQGRHSSLLPQTFNSWRYVECHLESRFARASGFVVLVATARRRSSLKWL